MYSNQNKIRRVKAPGELLSPTSVFTISTIFSNIGNITFIIVLGRILDTRQFYNIQEILTYLLMLSFFGMIFQIISSKYETKFHFKLRKAFQVWFTKTSFGIGLLLASMIGGGFIIQDNFSTANLSPITVSLLLGIIPLQFVLGARRGKFLGAEKFEKLSRSIQTETWSRFFITILLIASTNLNVPLVLSIASFSSLLLGLFAVRRTGGLSTDYEFIVMARIKVIKFSIASLVYASTLLILLFGDIWVIRRYFEVSTVNQFVPVALIAKTLVFTSWTPIKFFVSNLMELRNQKSSYRTLMYKYVIGILAIFSFMTLITFIFENQILSVVLKDTINSANNMFWVAVCYSSISTVILVFLHYSLMVRKYFLLVVTCLFSLVQLAIPTLFYTTLINFQVIHIGGLFLIATFHILFFKMSKGLKQKNNSQNEFSEAKQAA